MKDVLKFLLKGLLYLIAATVIVVLAAVGLFIYVVFAALAYGAPAAGTGQMIAYSDTTLKRWWWWRQWRNS
jgi:hypothetical protein